MLHKWIEYNKPTIIGSSITEINEIEEKIITETTSTYSYSKDTCIANATLEYLNGELQAFAGATLAYSKEVVDFFGDFNTEIPSEDVIMFFRGLIFSCV